MRTRPYGKRPGRALERRRAWPGRFLWCQLVFQPGRHWWKSSQWEHSPGNYAPWPLNYLSTPTMVFPGDPIRSMQDLCFPEEGRWCAGGVSRPRRFSAGSTFLIPWVPIFLYFPLPSTHCPLHPYMINKSYYNLSYLMVFASFTNSYFDIFSKVYLSYLGFMVKNSLLCIILLFKGSQEPQLPFDWFSHKPDSKVFILCIL